MTLRLPAAPLEYRAPAVDAAFSELRREDARNAKINTSPAFAAVRLRAPDGSYWEVTVDNAGVLSTAQVTP